MLPRHWHEIDTHLYLPRRKWIRCDGYYIETFLGGYAVYIHHQTNWVNFDQALAYVDANTLFQACRCTPEQILANEIQQVENELT